MAKKIDVLNATGVPDNGVIPSVNTVPIDNQTQQQQTAQEQAINGAPPAPPAPPAPATTTSTTTAHGKIDGTPQGGNITSQVDTTIKQPTYVEPKRITYTEMYDKLNPQPTAEELEKERKREKREKIIAAVGDGITALSNLFFATKGAKAPTEGGTMSEAAKARWEKVKAEREAQKKEYATGYLKAVQADDAYNQTREQLKLKQEADARAAAKEERAAAKEAAKEKREAEKHQLDMLLTLGKITAQEYANKIKEIDLAYENKLKESEVNKNNRSGTGGRSGGNATARYPIYNDKGELVGHAYTEGEAARETEKLGGEYPFLDKESETTTAKTDIAGLTTTTTTKKTSGKHARGGSGDGGSTATPDDFKRKPKGEKKPLD
jgi:hypothetical protein